MGTARWVATAALVLGVVFDLLFWGSAPGVNVPLFYAAAMSLLFVVVRVRQGRVHPRAYPLLAAVGVLALGPAIREEPMTAALATLGSFGLAALFAHTALDGLWVTYGAREYARVGGRLTKAATVGGATVVVAASHDVRRNLAPAGKRVVPVLRGAAMTLPLLAFFGILLGSADPVFADRLGNAFAWMGPMPAGELVTRGALVLFTAYGAAGVFAHALRVRPVRPAADEAVVPFLGSTEATVMLSGVNLLFAAFVAIQVRYLFGGAGHLLESGLTFAQYARRGFAELVVVAAASLVLLLVLAAATKRATPRQRAVFSGLAVALTGLVLVILASSFLRLHLYEEAFGFTRIRTYVHVFMVWLGLLLAALMVFELRGQLRRFPVACLIAAVGFTLTLQVLNVDGFIARSNVARVEAGEALDGRYLANVSLDAVPALVDAAKSAAPPLQARINAQLACHAQQLAEPRPWESTTLSAARARSALAGYDLGGARCEPQYW